MTARCDGCGVWEGYAHKADCPYAEVDWDKAIGVTIRDLNTAEQFISAACRSGVGTLVQRNIMAQFVEQKLLPLVSGRSKYLAVVEHDALEARHVGGPSNVHGCRARRLREGSLVVSAGTRRWFKLGGIRSGEPIGNVYHYIAKGAKETACGIKLPEIYGKFWGPNDPRCTECLCARKTEKVDAGSQRG